MLNKKELDIMRANAKVHKKIFAEIQKQAKPWVRVSVIDKICWEMCSKAWVLAWFKWVYDFPSNVCISLNDVVVHWVPRFTTIFKEWDVATFDFWVKDKKHWINTDSAFTMIIWDNPNPKIQHFLDINNEALYKWIDQAIVWNTVWDIWFAIQKHVEANWYHIVKDLTWHWVWKKLHEEPYIYNYWVPWRGVKLKKWMTLAIEPITWFSSWEIMDKWWWEIYIADGSLWCQFEHTILITDGKPEIII